MALKWLSKLASFLVPSASGSSSVTCSRRRTNRITKPQQVEISTESHRSSEDGVIYTVPHPDSSSCAGASSCYTNPIFFEPSPSNSEPSASLANPPRLAEGVIIDFVDTANMDDLPAWQLPQSRPAAGVLMTLLKHIPMVWGSKLGIHARTCQGATDVPSWQERIKGTAGRLMDGCKHSSMLSCSSSPSVVEEAVHNGPLCTEKDSTAQQCKASTPRHAGATDIPSWQQRMQSTAGRLQDGLKLSTVLNCFSPKPVKEARYDGPFCTAAEFNALFRMAWTTSKAIQRSQPIHWLHPSAVMLACLYQSLQTSTYQPRRLMKLLQAHMGLIHLVGPVPAEVGWQNMPPITPYIRSEQALVDASQGTLGDVCLPAHLPSSLPAVPKEVVKAARSLYPGLCSHAPGDLPHPGPTQRSQSEPVQDQQSPPQVLDTQFMAQETPSSHGKEVTMKEQRGTARPVISISASAAFSRASIVPVDLISTSGGAETPHQEESPILCSHPDASQGDETMVAQIWALTEEEHCLACSHAKQLESACSPAPMAARPLPEASTALRAGPSRPIFAGKSCRTRCTSKLSRKFSAYFSAKSLA
ncbi:g9736 [Coccomyxa viridis]|uniref:G9736 protein n=1 Tax=Coccomyxa viridis TaxID=1274662 RepID=A0ABP1G416_9CHLO